MIYALDDLLGHHAFEELVLFPLIRGSGESQMTSILAHEHCAIEPMASALLAGSPARYCIMASMGNGRRSATRLRLAGELMHHLQKEELNIVQQMDRLLDSETDHRLAIRLTRERGAESGQSPRLQPPPEGTRRPDGAEWRRRSARRPPPLAMPLAAVPLRSGSRRDSA